MTPGTENLVYDLQFATDLAREAGKIVLEHWGKVERLTKTHSMTTAEAVSLIAMLPREQAEAVLLRVVVGLDAQTAGRILGRRAGAVRTATYRGLRQLAHLLARDDPPVTRALAPTLKEVR